jgi:hypothetical protein
VSAPPIDLWPRIVARCAVPTDTHALLVAKLDDAARIRQGSEATRTRHALHEPYRPCRVGPGNFTPSPSQIRTGYSRIIRLLPSREGCRLPLNEGLLPANQLAQISGDDLRSSPITGPTSLLRGGPPFDQLPPLTCQTTIRSRPTGVTLNFLKAAASAVSRVGAITDPSSMLGLPIRYTNQSSVSAGSPMSEF